MARERPPRQPAPPGDGPGPANDPRWADDDPWADGPREVDARGDDARWAEGRRSTEHARRADQARWAEDARRADEARWADDRGTRTRGDDDLGRWNPPRRRRRPLWRTARLAGLLGIVLVTLVFAALVLPGLRLPALPGPLGATPSPSVSAVAASPTLAPSPTFVRPTPTPLPSFVTYQVRAGDSLTSIARQFETTPRSIAFWNGDTYPSLNPLSEGYEPDRIDIGWTLRVLPGVEYDELGGSPSSPAPGSPTPGAVTPPPSLPGTTPPPTTGGPAVVVSHGVRGTNKIALTFDMGGRLEPAADIMAFLVANGVRSTIFPTGKQGTEDPEGLPAMEIVRDHPELFELANHSWDHPSFTDLTPEQMREQLASSEAALVAFVGRTTKPWFRPPFGSWNQGVREAVGGVGWGYLAMWDIDTIDWRPTSDGGPTANDIEAKVLANAQGGSIVLMHLGGWHTLEALPDILSGLRTKGLEPVTLTDLLR